MNTDRILTNGGLGLTNMTERIEAWGGKLEINSGKAGTQLNIIIPVSYLPIQNIALDQLEPQNVT